jgi:hypothetical protein
VLRHVGIRPGEHDPQRRVLRVRRPDLLPVDEPSAVGLRRRPGPHRGEVGAGARLGEELAPHLVAAQQGTEVTRALLGGGVGHQGGADHLHADEVEDACDPVGLELLIDDDLLGEGPARASVLDRPGDTRVAGAGEQCLPGAVTADRVRVGGREHRPWRRGGRVVREPVAHRGATGGLLRSVVVAVHGVPTTAR